MRLIQGAPVRICVQPRNGGSRRCYRDVAWTNAAEMAWGAVQSGKRATVAVSQAGRVSYWDVKPMHGVRSATNITAKIKKLRGR